MAEYGVECPPHRRSRMLPARGEVSQRTEIRLTHIGYLPTQLEFRLKWQP